MKFPLITRRKYDKEFNSLLADRDWYERQWTSTRTSRDVYLAKVETLEKSLNQTTDMIKQVGMIVYQQRLAELPVKVQSAIEDLCLVKNEVDLVRQWILENQEEDK